VPPTTSLQDAPHRSADEPDAVCAAAVATARQAAEESADPGSVGRHLEAVADGERTVTHTFECVGKGYRGWRWAVTVARAPRMRSATVSEVVLLPGADAVQAPAWVPWSDRIAPGDLGAADSLPYRADDPYLDFGYQATDDEDADELAIWELGLGRARVLSPAGRDAAAVRWYAGDRGPSGEEAVNASAACASCGYFLPVAGALRQVFGVCANEWSPSDGRVVSVDHGCGAHSETDVERPEPQPLPEPILDETGHETVVIVRQPAPEAAPEAAEAAPEAEEAGAAPEAEAAESRPEVAEALVEARPAAHVEAEAVVVLP